MNATHNFEGIIPAVVTPLDDDGGLHLENFKLHIGTLAREGCHGVLLLGTTGEGPSLGLEERRTLIISGVRSAQGMTVLAGTGCANLTETIQLTCMAHEAGADAAVIVPPFYYKNPSLEGLTAYYISLLAETPSDFPVLLYHIPQVTGVPVTPELIERLLQAAPGRIAGIKDSSGDADHLRMLCKRYPQLNIFSGTDRLLLEGLRYGAAGCISAAANVLAPLDLAVYQAFLQKQPADELQATLTAARMSMENFMPFPPSIKYLLSRRYITAGWAVRPPLEPVSEKAGTALIRELFEADAWDWVEWLEGID
jgi:4-hydroxy-tetrahydrodipicolinate synthase